MTKDPGEADSARLHDAITAGVSHILQIQPHNAVAALGLFLSGEEIGSDCLHPCARHEYLQVQGLETALESAVSRVLLELPADPVGQCGRLLLEASGEVTRLSP